MKGQKKIYEYLVPHPKETATRLDLELTEEAILALEKQKIKSAITTDFILSVEIVIIAMSTVVDKPLGTQIAVVSVIALIATVGVYGIVGLIVRMDEFGMKLINLNQQTDSFSDKVGKLLVSALPWVIRSLGVIGTLALLLVAGGIFAHNIDFFSSAARILACNCQGVFAWIGRGYFGDDSGIDFQKAAEKVITSWAGLVFVQKNSILSVQIRILFCQANPKLS
ncbi:DUF808 family protein [Algoriphagus boritolerans]|uniref:DUF808 family protein n=1 Tax=Algoriphagus boritolerans TaxID=308111 RepID=UPI002FCE249E